MGSKLRASKMIPVIAGISILMSGCGVTGGAAGTALSYFYYGFITNKGSNSITAVKLVPKTGLFQTLQSIPVRAAPTAIVADTQGRFVFVANSGENTVSTFRIGATTGNLTEVSSHAVGKVPESLVIDKTGNFIYCGHQVTHDIYAMKLNTETGALSDVAQYVPKASTNPYAMAIDPGGQWLLVSDFGSNQILSYQINLATGELTQYQVPAIVVGTQPSSVAFHPNGKFVYVTNSGDQDAGQISILGFNSSTGFLNLIKKVNSKNPYSALSATVDVSGGYLIVTQQDFQIADPTPRPSQATLFQIDSSTGLLTEIQSISTGQSPIGLVVNPLLPLVYSINSGNSNSLSLFKLDATNASLTLKDTFGGAEAAPTGLAISRVLLPRQ